MVLCVVLRCVIVAFPGHTHFFTLFAMILGGSICNANLSIN